MTDLRSPSDDDLRSAFDHASDFFDGDDVDVTESDFVVSSTRMVPVNDLYAYDDIDPWLDYEPGELLELSPSERLNELRKFRGEFFAQQASKWAHDPAKMPPILVFDSSAFTGVADGRGRVNFAIGMGLKRIPVAFIRGKND